MKELFWVLGPLGSGVGLTSYKFCPGPDVLSAYVWWLCYNIRHCQIVGRKFCSLGAFPGELRAQNLITLF